jgi:hypothetical protein
VGHFHWRVVYDFELRWQNESAIVRRNSSIYKLLEKQVKGPPADKDLAPVLADPRGDRANKVFGDAVTEAFFGARGPNRDEKDRWQWGEVRPPDDFWK